MPDAMSEGEMYAAEQMPPDDEDQEDYG